MEKEKKEKITKTIYDPEKVVFSVFTKNLKGRTQCTRHQWREINDNELYCPICDSIIITK
jgi:hypothetical protein